MHRSFGNSILRSLVATGLICFSSVAFSFAEDPPVIPPPVIPTPAPAAIVAPKEATGTGKRADPFIFDQSTKCLLKVTSATVLKPEDWDTVECPADFEIIGNMLVFSLSEPGDYQVIIHGESCYARCWFRIKGPNGPPVDPNVPPTPESLAASITRRIKAAFSSPDAQSDAKAFKAAIDALSDRLTQNKIITVGDFEDDLKAGLSAVGWKIGKYTDVSKLMGEISFVVVQNRPITPAEKTALIANLKTISTACQSVQPQPAGPK